MRITFLGTGNANAEAVYNTCFAIQDDDRYVLVDGGGGNGIFRQMKASGIRWQDIHDVIITHKHLDHIMGIIWLIRFYSQSMVRGGFSGSVTFYAHDEVINILRKFSEALFPEKQLAFFDDKIRFQVVHDGECVTIINHPFTFFDIGSSKAKQFGFSCCYAEDHKLVCLGDEPFNERERRYAENADWLLSEAFCLYEDRDIFRPYEKHHSTVKDAAETAESLKVRNLVLYHTEDKTIKERKARYTEEGGRFFSGKLYVPEDLEGYLL